MDDAARHLLSWTRQMGAACAGIENPEAVNAATAMRLFPPELGPEAIALVQRYGTRQEFHKGQFIFYQGHTPIGIWLHQSGRIAFLRGGETVSECRQPCVLGFQAILEGTRLPHTARAEENVCVTFVGRSSLAEVFESFPRRESSQDHVQLIS